MIHHISISAVNPLRVAQALGELLQAQAVPFPPHPGSYIVLPFDAYGTAIEVYPLGTELLPGVGEEQMSFVQTEPLPRFSDVHAAISVPVSQEQIEAVGAREGWRVVRCDRGDAFFSVIEFWVENRLMLELLPPDLASRYLAFAQPSSLQFFLSESPALVTA